ncbi:carboxymuconolactone decarboxylase family protein [Chitinophaga sp. GbtcB8]|uniref:carboxymuconolactone decarboxylase family protein n=1 Tax=Chitinophaga sp. GbtcB8 TaxID=2824753 RepID=UPI001C30C2A8|nr:carboxymuconolactone decarboxylase family protein [Chitinophaga sp. GbtcB8]
MQQKKKEVLMRLEILNSGYRFGTKLLFGIIRLFSGYPLPDAARLVFYRPGFYGDPAKNFTHRAMRGPSAWSVGDRELMAAYISRMNECNFCVKAHSAVSAKAYNNTAIVEEVLADLKIASIDLPLKATLIMLGKLTRENSINAADMRAVLDSGVSSEQIEDALAICFAFNITNRLADAFNFYVPSDKAFDAGASYLLKRGYA